MKCATKCKHLNAPSNSVTSYRHNDYWVGLKRGALLNCTCDVIADCIDCRESWLWDDGKPMARRYQHWRDGYNMEPGPASCGRLTSTGWSDMDCSYKLKYICQDNLGNPLLLGIRLRFNSGTRGGKG